MITLETYDDVTRVVMSTRVSRAIGYSVSAYLVRGVLIDLGFPAVGDELHAFLRDRRPEGVLLTHWHEDHAGNVELAARDALPIGASPATIAVLGEAPPIGLYRRAIWGTPPRLATAIVPFDAESLRLVPTPGHSDDHHVVWDAGRDTLFAGDLFLGVKVRMAHPGERPRALARSVRQAAALRPKRLFDAHRGLVSDPVNTLLAKADWMDETIDAIDRAIAAGWSDRAIAREVLGAEPLEHYVSRGAMSKVNLVRAVRAGG
ncbi:MAG TPA: MBL fold metallo-hydrolase [Gemmatimonadaceae bacterium]